MTILSKEIISSAYKDQTLRLTNTPKLLNSIGVNILASNVIKSLNSLEGIPLSAYLDKKKIEKHLVVNIKKAIDHTIEVYT